MTLDETYERILLGIDREKREHAIRLLKCLAFSGRPLRVKELAEVLAVQFDTAIPRLDTSLRPEDAHEAVLSACSTLVAIIEPDARRESPFFHNSRGQVVQFSHYSVKEFLTSERLAKSDKGDISHFYISPEPAHTILAQSCISTLLQLDLHIGDITDTFPLAKYAAENWFRHAQCDDVASQIQDGMKRLFDPDKKHFAMWISIHDIDDPRSRRPSRTKAEASLLLLYYAALCGIGSLVEHLIITRQYDPNESHGNRGTPLHVAAAFGHTMVARHLLEHAADANTRDMGYLTPLHVAMRSGNLDIAQLLLSHGADANALDNQGKSRGESPLQNAVRLQRHDIVELLLKHGVDVNDRRYNSTVLTPLYFAARSGNPGITQLLVTHGADVNTLGPQGDSPLHKAVRSQKLDVVEILLKGGADVNVQNSCSDRTPLHEAAGSGNLDIAQLLLDFGAVVNPLSLMGNSPLHEAVRSQKLDVVELLLKGGADVHAQSIYNPTPLHEAARTGNPDIAQLLLSSGADINTPSFQGDSPLHAALQSQNIDGLEFLVDAGDGNTWHNQFSLLGLGAVQQINYATAELLLRHGADVNARGRHHKTPLHMASLGGSLDVARLLIEHGADMDAHDDKGQTPFSIAFIHRHRKLMRFLLNDRVPEHDAQRL